MPDTQSKWKNKIGRVVDTAETPNTGLKSFPFGLIFAFYHFAFWTVGNMIRDDCNEDLFMSNA